MITKSKNVFSLKKKSKLNEKLKLEFREVFVVELQIIAMSCVFALIILDV